MNRTKFTLAAIALTAMAISLASCGGSKPAAVKDGFQDVTTPADEFQSKCKTELKDYLCGVGENTSTNSQIARDVAAAKARRELASKIEVSLDAALKRSFNNTFNEEGRETTLGRVVEEVQGTFSNIEIHETKTQFNQKEGKYKVFVLVTVKKDDVKNIAENKLSNAQVLSDAAASKLFSQMIEEELNKNR
jgi:hypothetical protein